MSINVRKLVLTSHITFSVGWFGAVAAFLALAVTGLTSTESQMIRSVYICMELIGWLVIVPACIGSLVTGLVESLGTPWGLFKHYWIVVKFVLTIISTVVLFLHMQPISYLADVAARTILTESDLRGLRIQLIADAAAALLVLLAAITISVYKPWGKTGWGSNAIIKQNEQNSVKVSGSQSKWGKYVLTGMIFLVILFFILMHLKGGFSHH